MTAPDDIDALQATWKAATAGEWVVSEAVDEHWGAVSTAVNYGSERRGDPLGTYGFTPENAAVIVALHNAWPAIYERLRELEAERDRTAKFLYTGSDVELLIAEESARADRAEAERDEARRQTWETERSWRRSHAAESARADREAGLRQTAEADAELLANNLYNFATAYRWEAGQEAIDLVHLPSGWFVAAEQALAAHRAAVAGRSE